MKIHFRADKYSAVACGAFNPPRTTADKACVTCERCKKAIAV